MRFNQLDRSVATHNDYSLNCWRNDTLPIGLLSTDVRDVVPGVLKNPAQLTAGRFPAKGIWIMDKGDFHVSSRIRPKSFCIANIKRSQLYFRGLNMRILISNDDGIYSPGILALAEAAAQFGDVRIENA